MSTDFTVVFRSARRSDCEDRALVLSAVGIGNSISNDGLQCQLLVDSSDAARALEQLRDYEAESRTAPSRSLRSVPARSYPHAWVGCVLYVAVLLGVALMISNGFGRLDAFERGELDAGRVQSGEWWRAWTALTLHLDAAHLAANLGAGCWFGYLAARQLGSGTAWFLIVTGAACANLLEARFGPPSHRAVGASTAVFTALGLMAAHSWRTHFDLRQKWVVRWAPLIAGLALLGWTGSAGEDTDLVGHAAGFLVGGLLGATAALPAVARSLERSAQWLAGAAALGSIAIAWACALSRG